MPMKDLTPSERAQLHQKQLAEREARKKAAFSPGPGQYDMDKVDRNGKNATLADMRGETNPDWAFKSKSAQRREHKAAQTGPVGPGAYSPTVIRTGGNDSLASGKGEGNMAAATMKSVAKRGSPYGPPDDLVQLASKHGAKLPSPANYSPQQDFKGRNWEVQQTKGENISQPNAAFVSKSKQRQDLSRPYQLYQAMLRDEAVPGPGTYEPVLDERGENADLSSMKGEGTNPTYAFKSASKQRPKHKSVLGSPDNVGPGSYEPIRDKKGENTTLADFHGEEGSVAFLGNSTRLDVSQWDKPSTSY
jgi:hypothetical protein